MKSMGDLSGDDDGMWENDLGVRNNCRNAIHGGCHFLFFSFLQNKKKLRLKTTKRIEKERK